MVSRCLQTIQFQHRIILYLGHLLQEVEEVDTVETVLLKKVDQAETAEAVVSMERIIHLHLHLLSRLVRDYL